MKVFKRRLKINNNKSIIKVFSEIRSELCLYLKYSEYSDICFWDSPSKDPKNKKFILNIKNISKLENKGNNYCYPINLNGSCNSFKEFNFNFWIANNLEFLPISEEEIFKLNIKQTDDIIVITKKDRSNYSKNWIEFFSDNKEHLIGDVFCQKLEFLSSLRYKLIACDYSKPGFMYFEILRKDNISDKNMNEIIYKKYSLLYVEDNFFNLSLKDREIIKSNSSLLEEIKKLNERQLNVIIK